MAILLIGLARKVMLRFQPIARLNGVWKSPIYLN